MIRVHKTECVVRQAGGLPSGAAAELPYMEPDYLTLLDITRLNLGRVGGIAYPLCFLICLASKLETTNTF